EAESPYQEGGHLAAGDGLVGAEAVGAAAAGGESAGEGGGVGGEGVAIGVGEGGVGGGRVESPYQEGGHLAAGDGLVGAEAVGAAAAGDAGSGEGGDVGGEGVAFGVGEGGVGGGKVEGAYEEGGHLAAGDGLVGAEAVGAAAAGDARRRQLGDLACEHVADAVGERLDGCAGRPLLLLGLRLRLLRRRHLPCLFRFRLRLVVDGGPPRGAFGGEEHRVGGVPIALAVLADEGAPGVEVVVAAAIEQPPPHVLPAHRPFRRSDAHA